METGRERDAQLCIYVEVTLQPFTLSLITPQLTRVITSPLLNTTNLGFHPQGEMVVDLWGSAEGDSTYTADSLQVSAPAHYTCACTCT